MKKFFVDHYFSTRKAIRKINQLGGNSLIVVKIDAVDNETISKVSLLINGDLYVNNNQVEKILDM